MFSKSLYARRAVLSVAALTACVSFAQTGLSLEPMVVTATRTPQDPKSIAAGLSVIDASSIKRMGASSVNEAIRWLAGVSSRASTQGGSDQSLDLRGYGETAGSNLVVLVDGVRQNEGDFSGSRLSWLPIESVERIEVLRGNAAVLYGEGATGGVINVVTSKGLDSPGARVRLGLGSNNLRQASASLSGIKDDWYWQLSAGALEGQNHRDNFDHRERSGVARVAWDNQGTLLTARLGLLSSKGGLPGGLTPAESASTPRISFKPLDRGEEETANLLLGTEFNVSEVRVALDLSRRSSEVLSNYVSDGFSSRANTVSLRQSLRAWRSYEASGVVLKTLAGLDFEQWRSDRSSQASWGDSKADIHQRSQAVYLRQEIGSGDGRLSGFGGLRRTLAERYADGDQGGRVDPQNTSWELGGVWATPESGEIFMRWGTSFRLPNADEFSCYDGCSSSSVSLLKPQTSRDLEFGWRMKLPEGQLGLRAYRSAATNELGYDPVVFPVGAFFPGANINFDPTRRQGMEAEAQWKLNSANELGMVMNIRSARFTKGPYAGNEVPFVSKRTLTLRWQHQLGAGQSLSLMTQLQSSQRVAGDWDNTCEARLGGFGASRFRYAHLLGDWEGALTVNNLFDRQYVNYRTRCSASSRSVYPEAGRSWLLSVQRSF